MTNRLGVILTLIGLTYSAAALANTAAPAMPNAEEHAVEGLRAYDAGRYAEAEQLLGRAADALRLPTILLYRARALRRLGKFVQASELYLEAINVNPVQSLAQGVHEQARRDAVQERVDLLARIPRVLIRIEAHELARVRLTIDGTDVPVQQLNEERLLDPGEHVVIARYDDAEVVRNVRLHDGEHGEVNLTLSADPRVATGTQEKAKKAASKRLVVPPSVPDAARHSNVIRWLGWGGLGIGVAALGFGAIEGLIVQSKRDALLATGRCAPDPQHCDQSLSGQVHSYMTARTLATVGFVSGAVLSTAGLAALILDKPHVDSTPNVALLIGTDSFAVRGAF